MNGGEIVAQEILRLYLVSKMARIIPERLDIQSIDPPLYGKFMYRVFSPDARPGDYIFETFASELDRIFPETVSMAYVSLQKSVVTFPIADAVISSNASVKEVLKMAHMKEPALVEKIWANLQESVDSFFADPEFGRPAEKLQITGVANTHG